MGGHHHHHRCKPLLAGWKVEGEEMRGKGDNNKRGHPWRHPPHAYEQWTTSSPNQTKGHGRNKGWWTMGTTGQHPPLPLQAPACMEWEELRWQWQRGEWWWMTTGTYCSCEPASPTTGNNPAAADEGRWNRGQGHEGQRDDGEMRKRRVDHRCEQQWTVTPTLGGFFFASFE